MTMPHLNSGGSDDFFSNDEVKSYKYEGDEEKKSSENLSEDKLGLVTETEEVKGGYTGNDKSDRRTDDGKPVQSQSERDVPPFGYMPGYPSPYHNGATPPNSMGGKLPMLQSPLGVMMGYNNDSPFSSPPPAHMGIPPVTIDPKTGYSAAAEPPYCDTYRSPQGLPRHVYPYPSPSGQFPPSLYPDVQWQRPPGYPISSGALGGPYPPTLLNSTARYPHGLFPPGLPHPGLPHPFASGPKQESQDSHRHGMHDGHSPTMTEAEKKKNHIKKPLNAFMLFMKEQRAKVVAECTLKESAAINQILGRRWHSLDRSEQAKYYEMARKEKELHLQLYPGWSARDNYATHNKKKKRKKDMGGSDKGMRPEDRYLDNPAFGDCTNSKKCRARFGMDQQKNWCKPCRRKKKCIRVYEDGTDTYSDGEDEPLSDSIATGDSVHDSDSMLGSPTHSSTSEDVFSTPHKARLKSVESPLVSDSHRRTSDISDMDTTIRDNNVTPVQKSPFSFTKSEKYMASWHLPNLSSPTTSQKSLGSGSRSYSIDNLAISSATPERQQPGKDIDFTNGLSPLSSPGLPSPYNLSQQNSPHFSLSTFTEDINKNLSPKKSNSSSLNNSFSISTLSVSAVTPSRVHVT